MARVVIFGTGDLASLAWYVLTHDSLHTVVGFTADAAYLPTRLMHELPVVPFEALEEHFPPDDTEIIAPIGWREINGLRTRKHQAARARGYKFISYVSSRASVWPDLVLGENCMIFEGAIMQPFTRIGDGVIIRSGAFVSHHVTIADNCFLAPRACLGGRVKIGERSFVGLSAAINPYVNVAPRCVIASGAVLSSDTKESGVYAGAPARRRAVSAERLMR